jgi:hypothetical protein
MPFVLHLPEDAESTSRNLPRWQREAMTFVPGEQVNQGMPRIFFNHVCGGCHSSISGRPVDAALYPDFLTQASTVVAAPSGPPVDLSGPRLAAITGPPSTN